MTVGTEPINDDRDRPNTEDDDLTIDFGFYAPTEQLVSLGNLVWYDANNNGGVNLGEPGIPGVTLLLYREGQTLGQDLPIATRVTNSAGNYRFDNLSPGKYVVYIPSPPPLYPVSSNTPDDVDNGEDNDDNGIQLRASEPVVSSVIVLNPGDETTADGDGNNVDQTFDFGFFCNICPTAITLSSFNATIVQRADGDHLVVRWVTLRKTIRSVFISLWDKGMTMQHRHESHPISHWHVARITLTRSQSR